MRSHFGRAAKTPGSGDTGLVARHQHRETAELAVCGGRCKRNEPEALHWLQGAFPTLHVPYDAARRAAGGAARMSRSWANHRRVAEVERQAWLAERQAALVADYDADAATYGDETRPPMAMRSIPRAYSGHGWPGCCA